MPTPCAYIEQPVEVQFSASGFDEFLLDKGDAHGDGRFYDLLRYRNGRRESIFTRYRNLSQPRILFLTISDRNGASGRYRVYQFEEGLRSAGFGIEIRPPEKNGSGIRKVIGRLREERAFLDAARNADIVFIQKRLFSVGFIQRLRSIGVPIVFDFDDSIFTSQHDGRSKVARKRVDRRLREVLASSELVVAGNAFLAEYASGFASRVEILPTAVDVSRYRVKTHGDSDRVSLGWIGSRVTQPHLETIRGVLSRLNDKIPDREVSLIVVSDREFSVAGMSVDNRRWSEDSEVDDILDMDIGLMPLEDSEWTRGKCGLKALQYMAAGVPAVCSPVGVNCEIVEDGGNGFLCRTEEEWLNRIGELAGSADLRGRLGAAGRSRVEEAFSTERVGEKLAELLHSCLRQPD